MEASAGDTTGQLRREVVARDVLTSVNAFGAFNGRRG